MTCYAKSDGLITVKQHCQSVAALAGIYGREIGFGKTAYFAGLFHDIGKYSPYFQDVLSGKRSNIDHACSGAALFDLASRHMYRHVVEIIAAHHGSLDCYEILQSVFRSLLSGENCTCSSGRQPGLSGEMAFLEAFHAFKSDWPDVKISGLEKFPGNFSDWKGKLRYMLAVRMLLSCLVDADYSVSAIEQDSCKSDKLQERYIEPETALAALFDYRYEIAYASTAALSVNHMRSMVYQDCMLAGHDCTNNFYTLTAPTGSGKTLGMLRFALERCLHDRSKKRIIIVLPFLSISDQVAEIVRSIIPDVIIDNSAVDLDESQREIASRWSASCIITTTVNLFASLNSDRPGDCRKLHRLANAIILIDEVQSLPVGLSKILMQELYELSKNYNACVCLSTATQPAFAKIPGLDFNAREIISDVDRCFGLSRRTRIGFRDGLINLPDVADMASAGSNTCVIVNLKAHAREIYEHWQKTGLSNCYLLSTDLCGLHRQRVLADIKALQESNKSVHVIATQCIEAGVDLDFKQVFRALAPLPSLIQAAGRMNRNGQYACDVMTVFEPNCKSRYPGVDYEYQASIVKLLLSRGVDLNNLSGIEAYYAELFAHLYDSGQVFRSLNALDYKSFAAGMRLIKQAGYRVIVPYDLDIYHEILQAVDERRVTKQHLRKSGNISVSTYDLHGIELHCQELVIFNHRTGVETHTGVYILLPGHEHCYDSQMGLRFDDVSDSFVI